MKEYTFEKFKSLSAKRKLKIVLDLIYFIDEEWSLKGFKKNLAHESIHFNSLINYLTWIDDDGEQGYENGNGLKFKISHLINPLIKKQDHRLLLNIAILIERWLEVSKTDEIIIIEKKDREFFQSDQKKRPLIVVLDNLRSAFNVGSIFRTAECLGVEHIYLTGYTPTPLENPVKKTAMGTDTMVLWSHVEKINDLIQKLKSDGDGEGIKLIALETTKESKNLKEIETSSKLALFFGNERFGLERNVLEQMDEIVKIPMMGKKNSLNVSNAFAIAAYEVSNSLNK